MSNTDCDGCMLPVTAERMMNLVSTAFNTTDGN